MFRITASIVVCSLFIYALVNTYSWLWITLEVLGFLLLCGLVIHIDAAKQYPDDM